MSADAPHFLYRIYDADHVLLYIGCTVNVKKRMVHHRNGIKTKASRWLQVTMDSFDVTGPYLNMAAGHEAEADAIQAEQPLFNYQRRGTENLAPWMTRAAVARYLIAHGHVTLAEETCCECWPEYREVGERDPHCVPHGHLALPKGESRSLTGVES